MLALFSLIWLAATLAAAFFVVAPVRKWPLVATRLRAAAWLVAVQFVVPLALEAVDPQFRAGIDAEEAARAAAKQKPPLPASVVTATASDDCPAADPGDDYMRKHVPGYLSAHEACVLGREANAQIRATRASERLSREMAKAAKVGQSTDNSNQADGQPVANALAAKAGDSD